MLHPLVLSLGIPANSDFHPYVDLNAPRMRFLGRDALDLVRLGLLPTPLSDLFGRPLSVSASDSELSARLFTRHQMAQAAKVVVAAVVANDPAHAPEELREVLALLRIPAADCAIPEARTSWLNAVHAVNSRTMPFLPVADREPMWQVLRQQGCLASLDQAEGNWFGLLDASAHADATAMATRGEQLFVAPLPQLNGTQILEGLIAAASAKVIVKQSYEARGMLDAYVPNLQNLGDYRLALWLVMSQAQNSPE